MDTGVVQIIRTSDSERVLKEWEIRTTLDDQVNWFNRDAQPHYVLRLTPKGYDTYLEDGAGFFDQLFSHD